MNDLKVPVVVPARNAAHCLGGCPEPAGHQQLHEMIVIDGCSADSTAQIFRSSGARAISDAGPGLPAALLLRAQNATSGAVALISAASLPGSGAAAELSHPGLLWTVPCSGLSRGSPPRCGRGRFPGCGTRCHDRPTLRPYRRLHAVVRRPVDGCAGRRSTPYHVDP